MINISMKNEYFDNKAGYIPTLVACGWAGIVMEKVTGAFGLGQ